MWPQKMPKSAANPSSIPNETMTVLHGEPQSPVSGGISSLNRAPSQLGRMPRANNFQKTLRRRNDPDAEHLTRCVACSRPEPLRRTTSARQGGPPALPSRTPLPHSPSPEDAPGGQRPPGVSFRAAGSRVRCTRGGAVGVRKERPGGCESWASSFLRALPHFCVNYTPVKQVIPGTRLYNPRTAILPAPAALTHTPPSCPQMCFRQ